MAENREEGPPRPPAVRGERNERDGSETEEMEVDGGERGSGRGGIIDADMCSSLGGSNP